MDKTAWVDDIPEGPEKCYLRSIVLSTVLDARAIAKGDAKYFDTEANGRKPDKDHPAGKAVKRLTVLEVESEFLTLWLNSRKWRWYVNCLGWDVDHCTQVVYEIARGHKSVEITRFLQKLGASIGGSTRYQRKEAVEA